MASRQKDINAIELLESQHREVEDLFQQLEDNEDDETSEQIFMQLADKLALHAKIEELHFYPAVKERRTEDILLEALEEHLVAKRIIADLLHMDASDEQFEAKCKVLQEVIEHHVEEEEEELFPKVKKIFANDELIAIAQEMMATQAELEGKDPRLEVPKELAAAASL